MAEYTSPSINPTVELSHTALDDIDEPALDDIGEMNWSVLVNELLPQPPAALPPLQVVEEAAVEPFAETLKTPKNRDPRRKFATPTTFATPNTRSHARTSLYVKPPPTPRKPKSAPSDALISHSTPLASSQHHIDFSSPAPPEAPISLSASLSSSVSVEDLHSYVLDAFDSIISPLIPPPPEPTPSSHVIRRTLFRKQFSNETLTLIHHPSKPITSLDDLIPIIQIACASANLFLS